MRLRIFDTTDQTTHPVRSAMFNVLVIVALSAAVATKSGSSDKIDHRVVARDVTFYTGSICILVASASDGEIMWWEVRVHIKHCMNGLVVRSACQIQLLGRCCEVRQELSGGSGTASRAGKRRM